ncbi:HAMP domain-containing protein [Proteobacteria bacterium 005FR1]|nr:HAMP domain-containing protein [Proteobacteria bacterium 005FR1]
MIRYSLEGRFQFVASVALLLGLLFGALITRETGSLWLGITLGALPGLIITVILTRQVTRPINRILQALADGVASYRDGDFSVSLGTDRRDEIGALVKAFNEIGDVLRAERQNLFQRELLLDTVIQSTPTALVLTDLAGHVVYSNTAARKLFRAGRRIEGFDFEELVGDVQPDLLDPVREQREGLITVASGGEEEVFHLSHGHFTLNTRPHHLYLFKQLTRELTRQEVATWKKVIRVISHELNNSLAPITSLAHSGGELVRRGDSSRLATVFASIEERGAYLKKFIDGYARFAKLPAPQSEVVDWRSFVESLNEMIQFRVREPLPEGPGCFDPVQIQQVMLNLLKNAVEAGSEPEDVEVEVRSDRLRTRIDVRDRGAGMSDSVLQHALLPFYSTKKSGTGLGLSLSREIVEAHGGSLSVSNREGGGLEVSFWLPARGD